MKLCSSSAFSWSLARYIQPDLGEECAFADDALRVFPGPLFVELGGGFGEQKLLISSTSNSQARGHGVSMLCLQLWLGAVLGGLFDYFFSPSLPTAVLYHSPVPDSQKCSCMGCECWYLSWPLGKRGVCGRDVLQSTLNGTVAARFSHHECSACLFPSASV